MKNLEKKIIVSGKKIEVELLDTETGEVFSGVASCSETDVFDYEYGKKLATMKAHLEHAGMKHDEKLIEVHIIEEHLNYVQARLDMAKKELKQCSTAYDIIEEQVYDILDESIL